MVDKIQEQIDALNRVEATTVHGAPSRTPKAQMLDATALEKKNPDKYFRYVSTTDPGKPQARRAEGFTRADAKEAASVDVKVEVGPMVLMSQPREKHEARVAHQTAVGKARLEQHNKDVEAQAEAIVRELHDRHGIDVPIERFLVKE